MSLAFLVFAVFLVKVVMVSDKCGMTHKALTQVFASFHTSYHLFFQQLTYAVYFAATYICGAEQPEQQRGGACRPDADSGQHDTWRYGVDDGYHDEHDARHDAAHDGRYESRHGYAGPSSPPRRGSLSRRRPGGAHGSPRARRRQQGASPPRRAGCGVREGRLSEGPEQGCHPTHSLEPPPS